MAPKRSAAAASLHTTFSVSDGEPDSFAAAASADAAAPDAAISNSSPPDLNRDSSPLAPAAAVEESDADSHPPKPSQSFSVSDPDVAADAADDADAEGEADPDGAADDEVSSDGNPPTHRPRRATGILPISTQPMDSDAAATPGRSNPRIKRPRTNLFTTPSEPRRPMRVWSTEDEIAILQGLVNFRNQHHGVLPSSAQDISALHSNIRHVLRTKASTSQLSDKVRRLKQKYTLLASKVKKDPNTTFATSHDQSLYDLAKKVWGTKSANTAASTAVVTVAENNVGESEREESGESEREADERKSRKSRKMKMVIANGHGNDNNTREAYAPFSEDNTRDVFPYLWETVEELAKDNASLALYTRAFEALEGPKARTMEEKLRRFRMTEVRQQLRRMDLMKETMKLVVEAMDRGE